MLKAAEKLLSKLPWPEVEIKFWCLGSSQRSCRVCILCLAQTQRVGDWAHREGGLLNNPVKGQRSAIPSPFLGFLPRTPAPSVTCPLSCTPCHLHMPGTACHSHILFSAEERHPAYMLFLSLLSLQGVCLTDAYKLITCIFPVLQITQGMLAFCYFFLLFPLSGISFLL